MVGSGDGVHIYSKMALSGKWRLKRFVASLRNFLYFGLSGVTMKYLGVRPVIFPAMSLLGRVLERTKSPTFNFGRGAYNYKTQNFSPEVYVLEEFSTFNSSLEKIYFQFSKFLFSHVFTYVFHTTSNLIYFLMFGPSNDIDVDDDDDNLLDFLVNISNSSKT